MARSLAFTLAALAVALCPATGHVYAKSRAMSPPQYADFLNRLDAAVTSWQGQINHLNTINLPTEADKRKQLAMTGALASALLNQIKSKVRSEREHPSLALEITMSDTFTTALSVLNELIRDVPESAGKKTWEDAVRTIQDGLSSYAVPLHDHVIDKAYDLEDEAEDCHAQAQKPNR